MVVECSYPNREAELARISKHMHVDELVRLSAILPRHVSLVIVHRKPGREREIQAQLNAALHDRRMEFPVSGDSIDFPL